MSICDFIVVGAGIAGASAAAALSADARVVLVEQEEYPGYHATGRSAALFSEIYGNAPVRALSRASKAFFLDPPDGFTDAPLVKKRGSLFVATKDQRAQFDAFAALPDIAVATHGIEIAEMLKLCPALQEGFIVSGLHEPDSMDIDVYELHQGYLRMFARNGGVLRTNAGVTDIIYRDGLWHVSAGDHLLAAPVVINAAGAWGDELASMAGIGRIGLTPYRRTAVLVDPPRSIDVSGWPMIIDIDEQYYVKPDAGLLLVSPADETPMQACDAYPEEIDIATAIHRAEQAMALDVRATRKSWAGLRSFVRDRSPVVGFDPHAKGFFWLVGQGGYGIQTAPAMAEVAARLSQGLPLSARLDHFGVNAASLAPERLMELSDQSI